MLNETLPRAANPRRSVRGHLPPAVKPLQSQRLVFCWIIYAVCLVCFASFAYLATQATAVGQASKAKRLTRLFYHEDETAALRWADVLVSGNTLRLGLTSVVRNWPQLSPEKQHLTQLQALDSWLLSGLRDSEGGQYGSGWLLTYAGVRNVPHGDHHDWRYDTLPFVADSRIDQKQGNPAHVYSYGEAFYVAHDLLNGYSRVAPRSYEVRGGKLVRRGQPHFIPGGGNHITLAVDRDRVGYACWIDREGDNKGRVDVSVIRPGGESFIMYTFHLPWGGLHGAIVNSGKLFLAPEKDIVWLPVLEDLSVKPQSLSYHTLELGQQGDQALRTGAFSSYKNYVLFTTGREKPMLGVINTCLLYTSDAADE